MTPEQRARKIQADRDRRARIKAEKAANVSPVASLPVTHVAAKSVPVKKQAVKPAAQPKARKAPAVAAGDEPMVVVSFRGTVAQRDKLQRLGGGEWARARIDAATVRPGR
jgi:hypothetical protein